MSNLKRLPAFEGIHSIDGEKGVYVRLIKPESILSVLAHKNKRDLVCNRSKSAFEIKMRDDGSRNYQGKCTALGIGPGRWLFLGDDADRVQTMFNGVASISDHTDGYAIFGVSGMRAISTLAKGISIDLHPTYFTDEFVAVTVIAHIGAIVWKNTSDEFAIAVFRSYAESFWHWLKISAAEFGLEAME